ncbi:ankyrin repeat-containing domain protein [Morchella snyderi]|nr:ankyrin repeat-containing domain protein [Morchella snyderi]
MFIGALANEEKIVLEGCSPTIRFCYFHNPHTQRPMLSPFSDTSITEGAVKYIIAEGGRLALNCGRGQKWCRVLHWAIENENTRLVFMAIGHESVDINQRDWFNRTPLHLANFKCSPSLTKLLLNAGANVNAIDDHNAKPLHYAISRWKVELKKKNSQQLDDSMMNVLNLNLEAALTSGEEYFMEDVPLLHFAVEYRHLGVIETLLATRKGDVNVRDARGQTALFVAFRHKLLDMVDLLIVKYGADEGLKEETGQKYNYVAEKDYHYKCDLENLQRRVSQYTARGDIGTSSNYIRPWKNISRYSLNQFESP